MSAAWPSGRLSENEMRIAFVCGFAWEPKGTVRARAFPMAAELAQQGHEVTIFVTPYDNLEYSGKEWLAEGVRIKNLEVPNLSKRTLAGLVPKLRRAVHRFGPDLIHVFKPKGLAGATAMLLKKRARALVLDCDDWEGWGGWNETKDCPWLVKEFIDLQEKWLIRSTPVITAASKVLLERVRRIRGHASNTFYVPNCITAERAARDGGSAQPPAAEEKKALGLPDAPVVFYAGHFDPADDVMFFCRAVAPVLSRTGAALALVGEGPELQRVKEFFSCSQVPVHHFGRLPFEVSARS